jgi:hypothetical protein
MFSAMRFSRLACAYRFQRGGLSGPKSDLQILV